MTLKLDEIKKLAEEIERKPYAMSVYLSSRHLYADLIKDNHAIARHTFNLIAALEKCREQRDCNSRAVEDINNSGYLCDLSALSKIFDDQINEILEGKE